MRTGHGRAPRFQHLRLKDWLRSRLLWVSDSSWAQRLVWARVRATKAWCFTGGGSL